jgi:hypothetical protein
MIEHTATITAAYLGNHTVAPDQIPAILASVHAALGALNTPPAPAAPVRPQPAVSIRKSVTPDAITCLECGFSGQMIRRHLTTRSRSYAGAVSGTLGAPRRLSDRRAELRPEAIQAREGDRPWHPDAAAEGTAMTRTSPTEADEVTALLIRVRGFVERGWCRHAPALDADGKDVGSYISCAVAWCAEGAVRASGMPDLYYLAIRRLLAAVCGQPLWEFNDQQETVEPVLAAFDRAIAAGEP